MSFLFATDTADTLSWVHSSVEINNKYWDMYTATLADTLDTATTMILTEKLTYPLAMDRQSLLYINPNSATLDGATTSVQMYGGYSDSFSLAVSTQAVTGTYGGLIKTIEADVQATAGFVVLDPNFLGTEVTDQRYFLPSLPYIAFGITPATTFQAISGDTIIFILLVPPPSNKY